MLHGENNLDDELLPEHYTRRVALPDELMARRVVGLCEELRQTGATQ